MISTQIGGSLFGTLSLLSTVADAAFAFVRGDRRAAAFLLGAAVLSRRYSGAGLVASLLVRLLRRTA